MKIPVIDGPKVESRPIGTNFNNQSLDTGASAVSKGLEDAASAANHIAAAVEEKRKEADAIAVNDNLTKLQTYITHTTVGDSTDPNAPPGLLSIKGKDAFAASPKVQESIDKAQKDLGSSLANDNQRKLWAQHSRSMVESAKSRIEGHVAQQMDVVREQSLNGRVDSALNDIAANYADGPGAAQKEAEVGQAIAAFQAPYGNAEAKVAEWQQKVAATRMRQYVENRDLKGAEELFATSKDKLGTQAAQFAHTIQVMRQDREGETVAKSIVDSATNPEGKVDIGQAFAKLDDIPDVKLRDEARQRVMQRVALADRTWKAKVDKYADSAWQQYTETGTIDGINADTKSWLFVNSIDEWRKIENTARIEAERSIKPQKETDGQRAALLDVRSSLAEKPDDFRAMSPGKFARDWQGRLSPEGFREASRIFADLRKQPPGTESEFNRFVSDEIKSTDSLRSSKESGDRFRAEMDSLRRDYKAQHNGREPGLSEYQRIRADAWKTVLERGWLWDSQKPAFQVPKDKRVEPAGATDGGSPSPSAPVQVKAKPPKKDRVIELSRQGKSLKEITDTLNAEGY
jgi:hypothetical protein